MNGDATTANASFGEGKCSWRALQQVGGSSLDEKERVQKKRKLERETQRNESNTEYSPRSGAFAPDLGETNDANGVGKSSGFETEGVDRVLRQENEDLHSKNTELKRENQLLQDQLATATRKSTATMNYAKRLKTMLESKEQELSSIKQTFVIGEIVGYKRDLLRDYLVGTMKNWTDKRRFKKQSLYNVLLAIEKNRRIIDWGKCVIPFADMARLRFAFQLASVNRMLIGHAHPLDDLDQDLSRVFAQGVDFLVNQGRLSQPTKAELLRYESQIRAKLNVDVPTQHAKFGALRALRQFLGL